MALNQLAVPGKVLEIEERGIKYAYVHVTASPQKPTFLFLHGFPSSSYDWRYQINSLKDLGYGVLAPDLLGYGDTDKPEDVAKYKFKQMAADLVQILDHESLSKVIGVGHDWGCGLLSRMANYYPERFSAFVFVSVPYMEPSPFDLNAMNAMTEQVFGYPTFGYWKFFAEENAAETCHLHNESVTSLLYPQNPEMWKTQLAPIGAAKAYITSGSNSGRPEWLSPEDEKIHNKIFSQGGYTGPLNWYKATVRGLNEDDDAKIPEERRFIDVPTLLVVSDQDYVTRAEVAEQTAPIRLRNFEIKKLVGCGHWIQLEKKDEFSEILATFVEETQQQ